MKAANMNELLNIPTRLIKPPQIVMMLVNKDSLSYMELRDSIKAEGILQNLTVRLCTEDTKYQYEIVTGLTRYTVAQDLDLETVPCMIVKTEGYDLILKQIQENCCRKAPSKMELSLHFKRLLLLKPELTFCDLAGLIHKSPEWVRGILTLQTLIPPAKRLMEENQISMTAATVLSNLPDSIQEDLIDAAVDLEPQDFLKTCRTLRKNYKRAVNQGILIESDIYRTLDIPPSLRTMPVIKTEYNMSIAGKEFIESHPGLDSLEAWQSAIAWVLQLDDVSKEAFKERYRLAQDKKLKRISSIRRLTKAAERTALKIKTTVNSVTLRLAEEFLY